MAKKTSRGKRVRRNAPAENTDRLSHDATVRLFEWAYDRALMAHAALRRYREMALLDDKGACLHALLSASTSIGNAEAALAVLQAHGDLSVYNDDEHAHLLGITASAVSDRASLVGM